MEALVNLGDLRQPDRFGSWLCGIALNVMRRWHRQASREVPIETALAGMGWWEVVDGAAGPDQQAISAEEAHRVREALTALPRGQQEAVALFYLEGLSHQEVGATLHIAPNAVKARLHKARANLTGK